jgi:hypothetical protein
LRIEIAAGEPGIRREDREIKNVKNKAKGKMGKMARLIGICDHTRRARDDTDGMGFRKRAKQSQSQAEWNSWS